MPTTAIRIVHDCATNEQTVETYEIPDPTPAELAAQAAAEQQQIINDLTAALEKYYDSVAAEKKYGIPGVPPRVMCALRAGMVGSPFQPQGIAFGAWMDTCNAIGYQVMDDCIAGNRSIPTESEFISMMPPMEWP